METAPQVMAGHLLTKVEPINGTLDVLANKDARQQLDRLVDYLLTPSRVDRSRRSPCPLRPTPAPTRVPRTPTPFPTRTATPNGGMTTTDPAVGKHS